MVSLYRSGQQADAIGVYEALRRRLAEELGTDPGPSLARLHQAILRHDPRLDPVGRSPHAVEQPDAPSRQGNLPPARSSFIGRHAEVAEVAHLVRKHRLTTLVGAGGAGKTRLALQSAAHATPAFEGVWVVALGALDEPDHLAGHCLAELGVTDQMDRPPDRT